MYFLSLRVFTLLVVTSPLFAAPSPALVEAERELLALEQRWVRAENQHDVVTLREILADDFVNTFGSGKPVDKDAFIAAVTAGDVDPAQTQTLSDHTIRVDGDTALVVATDTVRHTKQGKLITSAFRYTTVYIKREGRWRAFAEHMVRIPPPSP